MKTKNKVKIVILLFLLFLFYYFLNQKFNVGIPCLFYELTGLYCPGCGITRMLFAMLKLDLIGAFNYNPLAFILITVYMLYLLSKLILKRFNVNITIPNCIYYILIFILIIYGILRNIPGFDFLGPK